MNAFVEERTNPPLDWLCFDEATGCAQEAHPTPAVTGYNGPLTPFAFQFDNSPSTWTLFSESKPPPPAIELEQTHDAPVQASPHGTYNQPTGTLALQPNTAHL
jgi:hypothetical protein